jgi:tetratricopeptide (TPR) repeat protein
MTTTIGDQVRDLAKTGAFEDAISACDHALHVAQESERSQLWLLRAYVHRRMHSYEEAVADASAGLKLEPASTPLLFDRARTYIELNRFADASGDLERLLEEEGRTGSEWHVDAARLLQVVCFNKLGMAKEAFHLCNLLPRDAAFRALHRLQTRAQLEDEARGMLME